MLRSSNDFRRRSRAPAAMVLAAAVGFALAALIGVAAAKTFTLQVAGHATVKDQKGATTHEAIIVNPRHRAIYHLTGDSKRHPECTKANGCFQFWVPVKVASKKKLSKAPGVKGKLTIWRRNGFRQVVLAGHPLYTYVGDSQRDVATGEGIPSFGGIWHVIKGPGGSGTPSTSSTTPTTGTTSTTTTTTCHPPYCY